MQIGQSFNAAPWSVPLEKDLGMAWDDPREIHRVLVEFRGDAPKDLQLQYWRHRWPENRVPKDRVPEGGSVGWWELGNWYVGDWQTADASVSVQGSRAEITFKPVNATEFPAIQDFPAEYRTTFKIRLVSGQPLPAMERWAVETDSTWDQTTITVLLASPVSSDPVFESFNGVVESVEKMDATRYRVSLWRATNPDPNSFDKTLLTIKTDRIVTVLLEDLARGPVCVADLGLCVASGEESRDYTGVLAEIKAKAGIGIHEAVSELPEQTWDRAWARMARKTSGICLPLGTDGGRHHFRLDPDGSFTFRTNNHFLFKCRGKDTERLEQDRPMLHLSFDLPAELTNRTIEDGIMPIGISEWTVGSVKITQTAFVTVLEGTRSDAPAPEGDATGICLSGFRFENLTSQAQSVDFPIRALAEDQPEILKSDDQGLIWAGDRLRALIQADGDVAVQTVDGVVRLRFSVPASGSQGFVLKIPYVWLKKEEIQTLRSLDFDREHQEVASYWRERLQQGMKLLTPEPMLNEFFQAHVGHLLINCEKEPKSKVRFARVGSFHYGVFGNEACMMIVDLDRRGYHQEAEESLEAFLKYQSTEPLPGDYSSQEGILYGTSGYECGGYNQHHGWTLWCLVEHYRFTRDEAWLKKNASHILSASEWIIRERQRTLDRKDLGAGLLPHGSLEDIGDWWQWLSTNVYSWRGLDAAGWALAQIQHPEAERVQRLAAEYRQSLLKAFLGARDRSPVVQLRDGTYVPHIPSHVQRRGRSFGWICETLEGEIHLLIGGVLDANSQQGSWIVNDYEDNLYLSPHYGYQIQDYEKNWFDWGGFSMQACLLFHVEPYLYRDEPKQALRGIFNAIAADYFPDTRMGCEHALPTLEEWRGDHYKSSDEANATGWLRKMFVREEGEDLLLGQAIPGDWFAAGQKIGVERASTYFGPMDLLFETDGKGIVARIDPPRRNPPSRIKLRFGMRHPSKSQGDDVVQVNNKPWKDWDDRWIYLPGNIGKVEVRLSSPREERP